MKRLFHMLTLVIAGEMVFSLPFHTARYFRPTLLEAFGFSNTQLGDIFAVYGVTAMLSYFPGGLLADRFPARKLMSFSLWTTAAGGLYMATFPGELQIALLYGYWGITSILLFWAALIRAVRDWGGDHSQGKAYGILEGGRGLVAAGFAVLAVAALNVYLPPQAELTSDLERTEGFRAVIYVYTAATAVAGLLAWFVLPDSAPSSVVRTNPLAGIPEVIRRPSTWAQAGIIVCAYCGYKGLDNYSLYAVQVLGMNEVDAARFTAWASYLRPLAAITIGILADRISAGRTIGLMFFTLIVSYGLLSLVAPSPQWLTLIYANIFVSFFLVYALRGVYFALMQETGTPARLTGTTVGIVSFIGFTPEIFFGPISGRILDNAPGLAGHQHYFLFLGIVALLGLLVILALLWIDHGVPHANPDTHKPQFF